MFFFALVLYKVVAYFHGALHFDPREREIRELERETFQKPVEVEDSDSDDAEEAEDAEDAEDAEYEFAVVRKAQSEDSSYQEENSTASEEDRELMPRFLEKELISQFLERRESSRNSGQNGQKRRSKRLSEKREREEKVGK